MKNRIKMNNKFSFIHFFCYSLLIFFVSYLSFEWYIADQKAYKLYKIQKTQSLIIEIQNEIIIEMQKYLPENKNNFI